MISRLLVANRGEIARRVIATCRALGVSTVAVHSDPDAEAPHVTEADTAVRLPGAAPADTYLRTDLLVAAALRAGADAVHPGYGFLSENAGFAQAVLDAGLCWVGPSPAAIAAMGSKLRAKELVGAAGVPVLANLAVAGEPTAVDLPLLVKASAGGGGRGMRVVRTPVELADARAAAEREAQAAFGDGTVFCERWIEPARHIEIQVVADTHGRVVALGERECSIQRRHQKVIEEAPSPVVSPALRERMCAAAVAAARAVGYVGAGTVEFLLGPDGEFFFLEMNTRLQVEHPVTECLTGLDLVRLQIEVAEGQPLPFDTAPPGRGHAIEARLYAEDPAAGWRPSTGTLSTLEIPGVAGRFAPLPSHGIRLDAGYENGSTVSPHYDAMLAKVIAWAPTRPAAARLLADALARARLHGVATNRDLLVCVLRHPDFLVGNADTGFLADHPEVFAALADGATTELAALAAALAGRAARRATASVLSTLPAGWRNNPAAPARTTFDGPNGTVEVTYRIDRDGRVLDRFTAAPERLSGSEPDSGPAPTPEVVRLLHAEPSRVVLDVEGLRREFRIARAGTTFFVDSDLGSVTLNELDRFPEPRTHLAAGSLVAPMPGSVRHVAVSEGDRVARGQVLLTLEAMKMEHAVSAPAAGTVTAVSVSAGNQVEAGAVLVVVTPEDSTPDGAASDRAAAAGAAVPAGSTSDGVAPDPAGPDACAPNAGTPDAAAAAPHPSA